MIIYTNYGYSVVYYRYIVDILLTKSIHDPFMKGLLLPGKSGELSNNHGGCTETRTEKQRPL